MRIVKPIVAAMVLASAAIAFAAGVPGEAPVLPYGAYPADERLTLAGRLVRPEAEAMRDELLKREIARVRESQPYQPQPAIWRISDADTTIYMFGTVHSLPPGFRWRNPILEGVIVRADLLWLESVDDANSDVTFREGMSTEAVGSMPPLLERASPMYRAKLAAIQSLLPPETVKEMDAMPTWIAAMGVGYLRDLLVGDMPAAGADDWLEQHFRATGKPIEAIENSKQVVTSINAIPEAAQRMMLDAALAAPDRTRAELDAPAHAWAKGDVGFGSPLIITPEQLDPGGTMADPLLAKRNTEWVDTLLKRGMAHPGTILFAAGAGHFVGPGSVIDLLMRRGIHVDRVQ